MCACDSKTQFIFRITRFFILFKPPDSPTGGFSLLWIQMPEHTVCCKDIGFLWGTSALWNLLLTEFDFLLTLAQGKWFQEMVSISLLTCAILYELQVLNITLVQMVYYSPSVCFNCSILCCCCVNQALLDMLDWFWFILICCTSLPAEYSSEHMSDTPSSFFPEEALCAFVCRCGLCACLCLMNCLYVWVDWIHESALTCLLLPLGHLPFPCLLPRLLLRSRDKAHWCLSAPWQITEADRYKDSGSRIQYVGGQGRTCTSCLSWPKHQTSRNTIWHVCLWYWCFANYYSERVTCGEKIHGRIYTRHQA